MTKEMLSPTSGSVGGGRRNSKVLTTTPEPPTGYPVVRSRGPASLIPKPRCDVAPPAYRRSGNGTALQVAFVSRWMPEQAVLLSPIVPDAPVAFGFTPKSFSKPTRVLRAKTYLCLPKV